MKNVCYAMNLKKIKRQNFYKFNKYNFSYSDSEVHIWISNANPGFRPEAYKNRVTMTNFPRKIDFFDGKGAKEIFVGPKHTGVVTESGELYTFGSGSWGVLGHGDEKSTASTSPKLVEYFTKNNIKVSKVCVGDFHTMVLTDDKQVYTWGFAGKKGLLGLYYSDLGALGHGDIQDTFIPRKVKFFEKNNIQVKDIACGTRHSMVLTG
jgi:alpha-tubulin suppressor-like RCC1 family protein